MELDVKIEASAPSNIALIKYMGKTAASGNLPTNASLSFTLEHLRSFVTLEPAETRDEWRPLEGLPVLALSDTGREKFLAHFARLKGHWQIPGFYNVRSGNNFPSDCGLASSASSFAALTRATYELARCLERVGEVSPVELSRLSRGGSGSSCRSLFSPWALWRGEGAEPLTIDWPLQHAVIVVHGGKKAVSSSQAHARVSSSLLFEGRPERAEIRLQTLIAALKGRRWQECFELCWAEFWDMHALFETSQPAFGYMTEESLKVLRQLREVWTQTGDGPVVTMDAGANIHLLLRPEQTAEAERWLAGLTALKSWS
jgi:diphosphomevalonate decarboxylase